MTNPRIDRDTLIKQAFATDEHLTVRYQIHERYSKPPIDFHKWVIDVMEWRGDEWVLDVGAGPGSYFEHIRERSPEGYLIGGDLSFGMATQAQRNGRAYRACAINLDVQALTFPDHTFDVVLANHMLYHVPDLDRALRELRRVLRRDGCLIAASNSENTMPEFDTLMRRACTLLGASKQDFKPLHVAFSLENGIMQLARYFRAVARYDFPSAFHFPETEPVMAYLNSMRALREPQLPEGIGWDDFMEMMERQVTRLIGHFGELQVHKLTGVLVATNGGGFARDYLKRLNGAG